MKKTYTPNEAYLISGLNRKDQFVFEDVIHPDKDSRTGYKEYNEKNIDKLIIIGFLKRLVKDNASIKKILRNNDFDEVEELRKIIYDANEEIKKLNNIILIAEDALYTGFSSFKINILNLIDEDAVNPIDDGNEKTIKKNEKDKNLKYLSEHIKRIKKNKKIQNISSKYEKMNDKDTEEMMNIIKKFSNLTQYDISSKKVQNATNNLIEFFRNKIDANDSYLIALAETYKGTGLTNRAVDQLTNKGVANFIGDSIIYHYEQLIDKEFDELYNKIDESFLEENHLTTEDEAYIYVIKETICIIKKYYAEYITDELLLQVVKKYLAREDDDKEFNKLFIKALEEMSERKS